MPAPAQGRRVLKAALVYFGAVFAVGFALGLIRVPFLVPRLGARWAELLELPVMLVACFLLARAVVRRAGVFTVSQRLIIGALALVLMLGAELGFVLAIQHQTLDQYLAGRDPLSGSAYALSLCLFALMPLFAGRGQGTTR